MNTDGPTQDLLYVELEGSPAIRYVALLLEASLPASHELLLGLGIPLSNNQTAGSFLQDVDSCMPWN